VLTPSDSDEASPVPAEDPQGSGSEVARPLVPAPSDPADNAPRPGAYDLQGADTKPVFVDAPEVRIPSGVTLDAREDERRPGRLNLEPQARKMDTIDFSTFVVSSRYVTLNLVMILLASAVLVAAFSLGILAIDSHARPGFTVGITSATTVLVTVAAGSRAVKRRHGRRKTQRGGRSKKSPQPTSRRGDEQ